MTCAELSPPDQERDYLGELVGVEFREGRGEGVRVEAGEDAGQHARIRWAW